MLLQIQKNFDTLNEKLAIMKIIFYNIYILIFNFILF